MSEFVDRDITASPHSEEAPPSWRSSAAGSSAARRNVRSSSSSNVRILEEGHALRQEA